MHVRAYDCARLAPIVISNYGPVGTEMNLTLQTGYLACNLCMLSFSRTFIKYLTVLSPRISLCKTIGMNIIHSQFACCIGMVRPWDESSVKSQYLIKSFTNFFFLLLSIVIIIVGAAIVLSIYSISVMYDIIVGVQFLPQLLLFQLLSL